MSASAGNGSGPTPPKPPGNNGPSIKPKRLFKLAEKKLSNLQLAIAELGILAALSGVGTVIEQEQVRHVPVMCKPAPALHHPLNLLLRYITLSEASALQTFDWYVTNFPDGPRKVLGFLDYHWIYALQLDHIYTSYYFLGLSALLTASLIACSRTQQWPLVKVAKRWRFLDREQQVFAKGNGAHLNASMCLRLAFGPPIQPHCMQG